MHIAATKNKTKDRQEGRTKQEIQNHSDGGVFSLFSYGSQHALLKWGYNTCFWQNMA
jgi:hypothetical protein